MKKIFAFIYLLMFFVNAWFAFHGFNPNILIAIIMGYVGYHLVPSLLVE